MNTSEREHRLFRPRSAIDGGEANGKAGCCPIPTDQQPPARGVPFAFRTTRRPPVDGLGGSGLDRLFPPPGAMSSQMVHTKIKN